MKSVSILGCGWLGLPLAEYLLQKKYKVKGSTTSKEKLEILNNKGIVPYQIDITGINSKIDDFLNAEVLIIAIVSKDIEALKKLVNHISSSTIKKVIFISSTSVYSNLNREVFEGDEDENTPLAKIEQLFQNSTKFETTIIRFAGLFGYDRQPGNWFTNRKIPHPKGFVNMIHRDDCIRIIEQVIAQDVFGEVFNACINHYPTREAFYTNARKQLKKEPPIFDDSLSLQYKIVNSDKLINSLNYQFIHKDLLAI